MRVLITGNLGYLGPVLSRILKLRWPEISLVGFDSGFFAHSLTGADYTPEYGFVNQYFGDIRDIELESLEGVDSVVHLASVSNDPMGNEFEEVTTEINRTASVRLAKLAAFAGVKNFVFASSCSMYGGAHGGARKETDSTEPLTAYARSKIGTEEDLKSLDLGKMVITSLRFATACGWSPRLRLDLVLNDFVACAVTMGEISVLSDGSPWRPLIDVEDMSHAIAWAVSRKPENGGQFLAINAGSNHNNFQVKDLALKVADLIPGTKVSISKAAVPDKRSYRVDFTLYENLANGFEVRVPIDESIRRLHEGLSRMSFSDSNFRKSSFIRLNTLRNHIFSSRLGSDLKWRNF